MSFQDASDYEELHDAQEDLDDFSNLLNKAKDWHEGREGKRRKSCSSMRRIQMLQELIERLMEKYEDQFQEEDKSDDEWGITTSNFPLVGKTQVQSCLTSPNALAVSPKSMKEVQAQSQPEEVKKVMLERGEEEEHPKSQRSQKEHLVSQSHTPNRLNNLQDAEELESNIETYLQSSQEVEDKSGPKSMQGPEEDMHILIEDMQSFKCIQGVEGMLVPKNLQEIEFVKDQVPPSALYTTMQEKKLLLKLAQPPNFEGKEANVEWDAEVWLEAMDDYFEATRTHPHNQTMLAMFRLTRDAKLWWKQHCRDFDIVGTSQSWEEIKDAVTARYLPPAHKATKMNEFFSLRQLSSTLEEYYSKFVTLQRYAPKMTLE
ncbi:hypothetical protein L7F22_026074 [Adiantum nelumboides]|nr:hypothetical protein [Adiantum nelumboides]